LSDGVCPNCGAEAEKSYCSTCGQQQGALVPTLGSWLSDTVADLLLVEARLPRTLRALFWPPGRLTLEWWQGRKTSFVSPLRVYLLAAVPFFFVFFTASRVDERAGFLEFIVGDLIYTGSERPDLLPSLAPLPSGSLTDSLARADWQTEFTRRQAHNDSIARVGNERIAVSVQRVFDLLPVAVGLTMVPLLAVLLAFRVRCRPLFIARLVFALHLHAVAYVVALLGAVVGAGGPVGLLGSSLYLVMGRREVFQESWAKASLLGAFIVISYAVVFLVLYIGFVQLLLGVAPEWISGSG
jgi:hypothetical protein